MKPALISKTVAVNGINLHYIAYSTQQPTLLMLHGLTANCYAFQGLIEAGLHQHWQVLSVDLRGRGKSSQPAFGYTIAQHAQDVMGLLKHLGITQIELCGHSFGGLLASYLAYHHPQVFTKVYILDAAPQMNPQAPQMLLPALARMDKVFNNFNEYLSEIQSLPYMEFWDEAMLPYYQADVLIDSQGKVECIPDIAQIMQISSFVAMEPWQRYFEAIKQPSTLIVGTHNYTLEQALLPTHLAQRIHSKMHNCLYAEVQGNHHTMLYKYGAQQIVGILQSI
jgi:pimeloyl-ACP methyl ester carboxylesterase